MLVDLNSLKAGWLELESDPGLFTLLLEDFGVKGVQVEEIYDLQKSIEGPVYGFIFLFKWIEERRSRRKIVVADECFVRDESVVNSIFFAHQIVPNSCATHSLLSVLLNCEKMYLGETLTRLKEYTKNMNPENKGYAIGNTPELARAHNSHAKPEPRRMKEKPTGIPLGRTVEAFHFVSYVPINGKLFELDGLKPYPIDHGPWSPNEDWTEKFRRVIAERLGIATSGEPYHDIRFNLMAVVPDRRIAYENKLKTLKINRQIVLEALQQLVKVTNPQLIVNAKAIASAKLTPRKLHKKALMSANNDTFVSTSESTSSVLVDNVTNTNSVDSCQSNCSTPTKLKGSSHAVPSPSSYVSSPHPALISHNYAKSPLLEGHNDDQESCRPRYEQYSGSEYSSCEDGCGDIDDDEDDDDDVGNDDDDDIDDGDHEAEPSANGGNKSCELLPPPKLILSGPGSGCHLPVPLRPIHVNTKDFSKPLSIQTKFETSPTPSCSSTDTSSEVGSAFNSPVRSIYFGSAQNSPNFGGLKDFKRLVVIRVGGGGGGGNNTKESGDDPSNEPVSNRREAVRYVEPPPPFREEASSSCVSTSIETKKSVAEGSSEELSPKRSNVEFSCSGLQPSPAGQEVTSSTTDTPTTNLSMHANGGPFSPRSDSSRYPHLIEPHTFAPKDLLALLKNIENEITTCELLLKDEVEKQKKYKIDDCRRTHNYDNFIYNFLSMLESHGLLTDMLEQQISIKRRQGINIGRLRKIKKVERKRKPKPRRRK